MTRTFKLLPVVFVLLLAAAQGCARKPDELLPFSRLEYYSFDPASPLEDRIKVMPAGLLENYRAWDQRPDYKAYAPTAADKALVVAYLRLLPPVYERVFKARCVGIDFVTGFMGNGVTNWVVGPGGKVYFHITLNPASLKAGLSETLTERERSCFIPRAGWDVRVDAGEGYKGLLYAIFHEGTHGLDFAGGVTPYADGTMPEHYRPGAAVSGAFFFGSWKDYFTPSERYDYYGRDRITFYGLGGGPKLDISEAPKLYAGLSRSGFVSLYGSRSWAEDLAELATFGVLTGGLNHPYKIILKTPDGTSLLEPMRGPAGERAAEALGYLENIK